MAGLANIKDVVFFNSLSQREQLFLLQQIVNYQNRMQAIIRTEYEAIHFIPCSW